MTPEQQAALRRAEARAAAIEAAEARADAAEAEGDHPTPKPPFGVRPPEDGYMVDEYAVGGHISRDNGGVGLAGNFMAGLPGVGEYVDEALGAVTGDPYVTARARGATDQYAHDHPGRATAARVAGGVTGGLAALPLVTSTLPAAAGMSLAGKVGLGAAAGLAGGTIEGGLSGYGSGTDPESRASNAKRDALIGGTLGLGLGLAAPALGAGVRNLAGGVADRARPRPTGMSRPVADTLETTLERDRAFGGGAGGQRVDQGGPDAMLADAGPATQRLLDTTFQRGGQGVDVAMDAVEARAGRTGEEVRSAFDQTFGPNVGARAAERELRTGTAGARRTAYDDAYAQPIDYAAPAGRNIEAQFPRIPGEAIAEANRLMRINGEQSKQILADVADDGTVTFKQMPDTRQLDYITRALHEVADKADGQGKLGGQTSYGRAARNLATEIREELKEANPAYADALETAADPIRRRQALRFGETMFRRNVSRDEVAETVKGMTGPERDTLRQGIRSNLDDTMASVTRAVMDGNMDAREAAKAIKDLSSRVNQDKLKLVLGDQGAEALFATLDRAARAMELRGSVARGSQTYGRQAGERMIQAASDGPLSTLGEGEIVKGTAGRIVQNLLGTTPGQKLAREDKMIGELARALTGPNPQATIRALERSVKARQRYAPIIEAMGAAPRGAAVIGYGGASAPTSSSRR